MNARTNDQTERIDPPTGEAIDDGNGDKTARLTRALRRVTADMTDLRRQRDDARDQVTRAVSERDRARHERDEAVADLNTAAGMISEASGMLRELLALPTKDRWRGSWIADAVLSITPPLRDVVDLLDGHGERPKPEREPEPPAPAPAPAPQQPAELEPAALVCGVAGCKGGCGIRADLHGASRDEPERCHYRYSDDCNAANADHCRRLGHPEHAGRCPHQVRIGGLL